MPAVAILKNLSINVRCRQSVFVGGKIITITVATPASDINSAIDTFDIKKFISVIIVTPQVHTPFHPLAVLNLTNQQPNDDDKNHLVSRNKGLLRRLLMPKAKVQQ